MPIKDTRELLLTSNGEGKPSITKLTKLGHFDGARDNCFGGFDQISYRATYRRAVHRLAVHTNIQNLEFRKHMN